MDIPSYRDARTHLKICAYHRCVIRKMWNGQLCTHEKANFQDAHTYRSSFESHIMTGNVTIHLRRTSYFQIQDQQTEQACVSFKYDHFDIPDNLDSVRSKEIGATIYEKENRLRNT